MSGKVGNSKVLVSGKSKTSTGKFGEFEDEAIMATLQLNGNNSVVNLEESSLIIKWTRLNLRAVRPKTSPPEWSNVFLCYRLS